MMQNEYSLKQLEWLLSNYSYLDDYRMPPDDKEMLNAKGSFASPFELAAICKTDIDEGMKKLSYANQIILTAVYNYGRDIYSVGDQLRFKKPDGMTRQWFMDLMDRKRIRAVKQLWRAINGLKLWGKEPSLT